MKKPPDQHNRPELVVQHCLHLWIVSENSTLDEIEQVASLRFLTYICVNICKKEFKSRSGLSRHKRFFHTENQLGCGICTKTYKSRDALRRHERTVHQRSLSLSSDVETFIPHPSQELDGVDIQLYLNTYKVPRDPNDHIEEENKIDLNCDNLKVHTRVMDQLNNNDDIGSIAETLKYSSGDIDLIEMNTRGQSNNNLWFAMRKGKFDLDILSIYPTPEKFLRRPEKQQWVDYLQIKLVNSKSQTTIFPMLLDPEIGASNTVCERLGGLVNDAEEGTKECNSKMKLTVVNKYPRLCLFPSVILRKGKKFVMFMERSRRSCHGIGNFSSPQASVPVGKEVGAIASTVVVEPVLTKASVPVVKEVGAIASTVAVEPVEAKTKASTVVVEPVVAKTKASVPVVKEVGAIASTVAVEPVEAKTKASTVVVEPVVAKTKASVPVVTEVGVIASTVVIEPVVAKTKASVPVVKEVGAIASTGVIEPVVAKAKKICASCRESG
ncbi:unnamed protein product [Mytilus edulis]|uniref:C2H2-type domain-containing protein n=1 Tax=Mytilus edulis TaxID=6550 RepID=A0A8S3UEE4_MYTED|nr:unnamed protein product [Mytilus edulis]